MSERRVWSGVRSDGSVGLSMPTPFELPAYTELGQSPGMDVFTMLRPSGLPASMSSQPLYSSTSVSLASSMGVHRNRATCLGVDAKSAVRRACSLSQNALILLAHAISSATSQITRIWAVQRTIW